MIATTAPPDTQLQALAMQLTEAGSADGPRIVIYGWSNLCEKLELHDKVFRHWRRKLYERRPSPRFTDEATRELSEALEQAQLKHEELTSTGQDPTPALEEILDIKRRLREGGQLQGGDFLAEGRFHLLEPLGQGGFSSVFKAYDRQTNQLVAVKVLHGQYAKDRSRRERFFRGARKMFQLQHQGIVRVIEPKLEDEGYHFFVMEYVEGGDLRQAVLDGRIKDLKILLLVAEALDFAHRQGNVHRDVKPANILLTQDGDAKLTDFDLVRAFDTTGGTGTGSMLGTFLYMAPEAMQQAKDVGPAADVYSLAVTAAFVLHGEELPPTMLRDAGRFFARLEVPPGVKKTLERAASWEVNERPSTATHLINALTQGLEPVEGDEEDSLDELDVGSLERPTSGGRPKRRSGWKKVTFGVIAAMFLATLGYLSFKQFNPVVASRPAELAPITGNDTIMGILFSAFLPVDFRAPGGVFATVLAIIFLAISWYMLYLAALEPGTLTLKVRSGHVLEKEAENQIVTTKGDIDSSSVLSDSNRNKVAGDMRERDGSDEDYLGEGELYEVKKDEIDTLLNSNGIRARINRLGKILGWDDIRPYTPPTIKKNGDFFLDIIPVGFLVYFLIWRHLETSAPQPEDPHALDVVDDRAYGKLVTPRTTWVPVTEARKPEDQERMSFWGWLRSRCWSTEFKWGHSLSIEPFGIECSLLLKLKNHNRAHRSMAMLFHALAVAAAAAAVWQFLRPASPVDVFSFFFEICRIALLILAFRAFIHVARDRRLSFLYFLINRAYFVLFLWLLSSALLLVFFPGGQSFTLGVMALSLTTCIGLASLLPFWVRKRITERKSFLISDIIFDTFLSYGPITR